MWGEWEWPPGIWTPIVISAVLYWRGAPPVPASRRTMFWSGLLIATLALVSPLHEWGEQLFSAHMLQHEILMLIGAPLLAASRPWPAMLRGIPLRPRIALASWTQRYGIPKTIRLLTMPIVAWTLQAIAIWVWHIPVLFQATLDSSVMHAAQHASFFVSAFLFWRSLDFENRNLENRGVAIAALFTTAIHTGVLGALLTFAPSAVYPAYGASVSQWGLSALEDQQIGGLIMWVPGGIVYLGAALASFARWLRESEGRDQPAVELHSYVFPESHYGSSSD